MMEEWSQSLEEWRLMMTDYPILQRLHGERIFNVGSLKNGKFGFREQCDDYFSCELTVDDVRALARELERLAGTGIGSG